MKGISILLNFALVPILLSFLGKPNYGVWITVFSISSWVLTFDLGIGQGLRNKLTEALTENNTKMASRVISSAFISVTLLSLVMIIIGSVLIYCLDFQKLFNFQLESNRYLQKFILISLVFMLLNFILSLYKRLYLAIHKSYLVESINVIFLTFYVTFILTWNYMGYEKSLINLMFLYGNLNLLISAFALFSFFKINSEIRISIRLVNIPVLKSLFGLSMKFFIINLALLIILSTDNLIIANLLGPSHVTDYYTIQRIYQFVIVIFTLILTSSWSLYSEALILRDYHWIKKNLNKMNLYFLIPVGMGLFLFLFRSEILELWMGKGIISEPKYLSLCFFLYACIFCYTNIYNFFINASNKLNLQMYLYVFGAVINIPLSIIFVQYLGSSTGVILATIFSSIPLLISMPIQSRRILKGVEK